MPASIIELWRFPVKSMKGERLQAVAVTEKGFLGDRAYGIFDMESGKVATAKKVKVFPRIMDCRAVFIEPPTLAGNIPPVRIDLPDGQTVRSDDEQVDQVLSTFFNRAVRLVKAFPDMETADQYTTDALTMASTEHKKAAIGALRDAYSVSLLTTSTLEAFNRLQPGSRFDSRRFRMNIIVKTQASDFVENNWVKHQLQVGEGIRLDVLMADPRCIMTTLPQDDLPRDPLILRAAAQHNRVEIEGKGKRPCAGVYAAVAQTGTLHIGDVVRLE